MRMGDLASPIDGNSLENHDGTQISWNNCLPATNNPITVQDNPDDEGWKVSYSPNGAFIKNHKGNAIQSIEPIDRSQRDTFIHKSGNWKDLVEATSPIVSSFLSKPKDPNPSAEIDVLGAAVQKLTSDAENLSIIKTAEADKLKGKSQRAGDNALALAKQTTKSKMLAEINRRRRAKTEEEKRASKQSKDDLIKGTKTSCTVCGVAMAEGPRNICKSCMSRQKRDKSREKNQNRDIKTKAKSPIQSPKIEETCNSDTDTISKDIETSSQSPVVEEVASEDNPARNRSMSLDIADSTCETNKKYSPQKRTHTDLGPNSFSKSTQDKSMTDISQTSPAPQRILMARNLSETNPTAVRSREAGMAFNLDYPDKSTSKLAVIGSRVMKRSTTDSEIVSKSKLISKNISGEEHKAALVNSAGRQNIDDAKKRGSPKTDKKESLNSGSKQSSQETMNVGMKLERSKTVMGKMNVDGDKKAVIDIERTRKKEGSNVSAESEKSYSNKKYTNPGRSHTIIGDGHNKRQKNKGDWTKNKGGKSDSSNGSKDMKKKPDKRGSVGDEEGRRVSFVEGDTIKKSDNEENVITCINNAMPLNLYDYVDEDGDESSSDSEGESETPSVVKVNESKSSSRTEIPEAVRSRGIPVKATKTENKSADTQAKRSWSHNQADKPSASTTKYGNSSPEAGGYDSPQSKMESEPEKKYQSSRWSEENAIARDYETRAQYEDQNMEYEQDDPKENDSECSYSEHRALGKIEEEEYITDEEDSDEDSTEELYTRYPSIKDGNDRSPEQSHIETVSETYFEKALPTGHILEQIEQNEQNEQSEQLYTTLPLTQPQPVPKGELESYFVDKKASSTEGEYTEPSYLGHWTQAMIGNGDSAKTYFNAYETDVDTGLSVLHPQNEKEKPGHGNEWGFSRYDKDDSSSSSDDEDDQIKCSDSWYTGGYYDETKSENGVNNDDLVYFNDKAAKKLSESEIYTGELFSNVVAKGNGPKDMSKNNNITLEDNLFEGSNFWIISSRPQMHQTKWDHHSRTKTMCPNWVKDHCANGMFVENLTLPVCNVSNNNNDDDDGKLPGCSSFKGKFPVQIACKSDYTEYTPELLSAVKTKRPKKEIVLLGNKDFTKYDRHEREERVREDRMSFLNNESHKADTLFFGDEPPRIPKQQIAKSPAEHSGLYFNKHFTPVMCVDHSPENVRPHYPKDDDYQGGFFYATRYESNNNNNNDYESDSYTGCFRNEEEYKPTHDGLFNDKASSFVFQKRAPEPTPLYFCNVSSKSYYDTEESVYAFEKKKEKKVKPPEAPKILKVGSIVIRNNVECEVDYAQNIDMDSQDVPKTWMRYDYGGDSDVADTSSYAQNVSFEEFGGAKPWVMEGCRAPWKVTKETAKEKKGKDEISNKNGNGSWKPTPDKMVKSVKSLGSYVTKWF